MRTRISGLCAILGMAAIIWQEPAWSGESPPAPKTTAQLVADLDSGDVAVRRAAVQELATRSEEARSAIQTLAGLLKDPDGSVRAAAAETLGKLRLEPEVAVPALVAALSDETPADRGPVWVSAGLALGDFQQPAVPHLAQALKSENLSVRRAALAGIYRAGPVAKETLPDVIAVLQRNEPDTRIFALNAVIGIGPDAKDAIPAVIPMLSSDDFHTQYWACRALGAIGPDAVAAKDELIHRTTDRMTSVRRNAARALGNIGPAVGQPAVEALTKALSDPNQLVRQDAVIALGKLKPLSAPAAPAIEDLLQKPQHFVPRAHAAKALWLLQPASKTPVAALLQDLVNDDEPWEAARVLGEIDLDADTIDRLIGLLQSKTIGTREYAAVALGEIGADAQRASKDIEKLLQDEVEEVREAATEALKKLPGSDKQP